MLNVIFIMGFSGSGKSELYKRLNVEYPDKVFYPKSYTTRSPRSDVESLESLEYQFISEEDYFLRKSKSSLWSEAIIHNNYYGIDISSIYDILCQTNLKIIRHVYPGYEPISEMVNYFENFAVKQIFIMAKAQIRESRIQNNDKVRLKRLSHEDDTNFKDLYNKFGGVLLKNENISLDELYERYVQAIFC